MGAWKGSHLFCKKLLTNNNLLDTLKMKLLFYDN